jgi:hypothetical protein
MMPKHVPDFSVFRSSFRRKMIRAFANQQVDLRHRLRRAVGEQLTILAPAPTGPCLFW